MLTACLLFLAQVATPAPVNSTTPTPPETTQTAPQQVVAPKCPLTKYVTFVVDTSGSMMGYESSTVQSAQLVTQSPTDDYYIKATRFGTSYADWRDDWTPMPDQTADQTLTQWIRQHTQPSNTWLMGAIRHAILDTTPDSALTIVLITDGVVCDNSTNLVKAIVNANKKREKRKQHPAAVWCIYPGNPNTQSQTADRLLREIATKTGGGYYRLQQ